MGEPPIFIICKIRTRVVFHTLIQIKRRSLGLATFGRRARGED